MKTFLTIYFLTFYLQLQNLFQFEFDWFFYFINEENFVFNTKAIESFFTQFSHSPVVFFIQFFLGLLVLFTVRKLIPLRFIVLGTFVLSNYLWLITYINNYTEFSNILTIIFHFINILILATIFIILRMVIDTMHYLRTDQEMIETGLGKVPNTAKIIRHSLLTIIFFLIIFFLINHYFLETKLLYIYIPMLIGSALLVYDLSVYIYTLYCSEDKRLEIRKKKGYIPEAYDKHEYAYAMQGLAKRPHPGVTSSDIYSAAENFDLDKLKILLKQKMECVDEENTYGWTPLMIIVANASHKNNRHNDEMREQGFQILSYLISIGADINHTNSMGRTSIDFAINYNDPSMVRFLLEKHAVFNKKQIQSCLEKRYIEIYELLKEEFKRNP